MRGLLGRKKMVHPKGDFHDSMAQTEHDSQKEMIFCFQAITSLKNIISM